MESDEKDIHPIVSCFTTLIMVFWGLISLYTTYIAFVGGILPIIYIKLPGGFINGLLWLFFVDPIVMTVGYWISMIIVIPLHSLIFWLIKDS